MQGSSIECSVALKGSAQLRRVQRSLVGCRSAQLFAAQRLQRAQKSVAQLCKMQHCLVECSVAKDSTLTFFI